MGFIVSPNRTEEDGAPKWLRRDFSELPKEAKEFDFIIARGVSFTKSPDPEEIGFGNGIVAYCGTADGDMKRPTRRSVREAEWLFFEKDMDGGGMYNNVTRRKMSLFIPLVFFDNSLRPYLLTKV